MMWIYHEISLPNQNTNFFEETGGFEKELSFENPGDGRYNGFF